MGKISVANLKKTIYYLKRNGIKNTCYAMMERLGERNATSYNYVPISEEEKKRQRLWSADKQIHFSIVVPTYRTNEAYLYEMIQSVAEQTYPHWELILADATEDDCVKKNIDEILGDKITGVTERIHYIKLAENAGIAANTNQALLHTSGDYIGLLDHDDVLTENALYEMALCIEDGKKQGKELQILYSDEDKCNGDRTKYYEPHHKERFNLDLLLSNNYVCHFLVMKCELLKELGFRSKFDGAQDYDLVLRGAEKLWKQQENIVHISKVLYHWRCHTGSTAENPQSKQYAYDAGLMALQDYADRMGYGAKAEALKHLGFYTLRYPEGALKARSELGAVGGRVLEKKGILGAKKLIGGRMDICDKRVRVYYENIPAFYSGYMHRAVLTQQAEAVDIRCIQVREECRELFERVVGVPYKEIYEDGNQESIFDASILPKDTDYKALSIKFCKELQKAGYRILYQPRMEITWKA